MKFICLMSLFVFTMAVEAKDSLHDFNKVLMEKVQKDIVKENDQDLKKSSVGRGPASVTPEVSIPVNQEKKFEKNQIGSDKW